MRKKINLILAVATAAVLPACQTGETKCKGTVEKSCCAYRNSFEFVWQSAQDELASSWKIEKAEQKTRTITTAWSTQMSPFSSHGRRDRLIVTIVGDNQRGWSASAKQDTQTNTNEENPLDEKKAKWEEMPNDGGLAAKFLQNLDTRLQPDERWRDRIAR
jgi:hypothetical protein